MSKIKLKEFIKQLQDLQDNCRKPGEEIEIAIDSDDDDLELELKGIDACYDCCGYTSVVYLQVSKSKIERF